LTRVIGGGTRRPSAISGRGATSRWEFQLLWADRTAQQLGSIGPSGTSRGVELSPNGKRVAVHRHDTDGALVMTIELSRTLISTSESASRSSCRRSGARNDQKRKVTPPES
jgi:hypothetical protein